MATEIVRGQRLRGLALMLGGASSNQVGAAIGAHAFSAIGPAGVVAIRQLVAAAVLLPTSRPAVRAMTWAQWRLVLMLAGVFSVMNLSLYAAIDRLGLGLAITLEFLGPLGVALVASRTRGDLFAAIAAGAGVYVLVLPGGSSDWWGITLALLAAGCWASYIVLNRRAGAALPGLQAPALAAGIAALIYLPVLVWLGLNGKLTGLPIIYALIAGVLSSTVPYAVDLLALRFVPPRLFGIVMSANPVLAALAGWAILSQALNFHEWVGIVIVVAANVYATTRGGVSRRRRELAPVLDS